MATVDMVSTANSSRLICLLFLLPAASWGGDWKITPGISLSERYSDNVNLATTGQERSDWITEVTPRISLRRQGARIKANVDYSLQGLLYADDSGRNTVNHNLNGRANAELKEGWFYLDASARVSQVLDSLSGGAGQGDGVGIGNTSSVGAYSVSPYLKHRFGSAATVEARLAQDEVFVGTAGIADSSTTRFKLSAVSGKDFFPLSWDARYDKADTSNSVGADTGSEHANANARYRLSRKYGLLAQASMEKNDFTGVSNKVRDYSSYGVGAYYTPGRRFSMDVLYNHSDNGGFWSGNVTLNPTLRTKINASTTQRAFGRSSSLGLAHRTRRSNWSLSYEDSLASSQQQFSQYLGSRDIYYCPGGIVEFVPVGAPPTVDPVNCTFVDSRDYFSQTQVNEIYLSKNLIGTVSYTQRRNTWLLSLYNNQREFQTSGNSDTTRGMRASWSLKPSPRTTFTLTGGMSQVESSLDGREDDLWNLSLVATRKFQPKVSGSMEVRHQERDSNQANGDYSENSLAARLNMTF